MRILIIFIAILAASCNSKSGQRQQETPRTEPAISIVQVLHPDGMVENIQDTKYVHPSIGDTVIIWDGARVREDSSIYSNRILWGRYLGSMPIGYETDSMYSRYYAVRVLRYVK